MIIKGNPAGNIGFWSKHLLRDDTNERAEVKEISGLLADNLPDALREMRFIAAQSRSQGNFMYQANINPQANETLTPEQWIEAVDTLEKNLGLEGHQRVVVEHVKDGRQHYHVVWNRVDVDTLRVTDMGGNYYTHEKTARELESSFDLTPTPTPQAGKTQTAPELYEIRLMQKTGINRDDVREEVTNLWRSSDGGQAFAAALAERGYILANGDRRDFCIIDQLGGTHSLARRLDGVKAQDVRDYMADVDRNCLPSVAEAVAEQRDKGREWSKLEIKIETLQATAPTPESFAASLYREGITIARVDENGLAALKAGQERREWVQDNKADSVDSGYTLKTTKKFHIPNLKEGDLCAINDSGFVYRLNQHRLDIPAIEVALTTGEKTIPALGEAREFILSEATADKELKDKNNMAFWQERAEQKIERESAQHEKWEQYAKGQRDRLDPISSPVGAGKEITTGALAVVDVASGAVEKLGDFILSFLGGGESTPQPSKSLEQIDQIKAQRKAVAALENIRDSMERGEGLRASDIQNLTPTHLENIRLKGDDYLRNLVARLDYNHQRTLENEWGRERER